MPTFWLWLRLLLPHTSCGGRIEERDEPVVGRPGRRTCSGAIFAAGRLITNRPGRRIDIGFGVWRRRWPGHRLPSSLGPRMPRSFGVTMLHCVRCLSSLLGLHQRFNVSWPVSN